MARIAPRAEIDDPHPGGVARRAATRWAGWALEAIVLAMVCLSPWPFGSARPRYEFLLDLGVAALMALWGGLILLKGAPSRRGWRWRCAATPCLAALVLIGVVQVLPVPGGMLGWASPATARLYHQVLPARPEVLPFGEPRADPGPPAGSTLSLDPGATRREVGRLLAVLLLFAVVHEQVASVAFLRRLGLVAAFNGSLLALFALVQFFSSDPQTIYWTIATAGAPFGPFVNRNHCAFYLNLCIGLATGLLLARLRARQAGIAPRAGPRAPAPRPRAPSGPIPEAEALGLVFALALMSSSVLVSLSRGGLLALAGGSILGVTLATHGARWSTQGRIVLVAPVVTLALVSWFGIDRVATRLQTLRGGVALQDDRLSAWSRALPLLRDFPLWGTGYGTYEVVDMLHRSDADAGQAGLVFDHAHNDYLEMQVEAGLPGLIAVVSFLVVVSRHGLRAVRRDAGGPAGGLALGALIALATIAIHSVSDFSLHMPANAVFATVLCAVLCALGGASVADPVAAPGREPPRLRGLAPALVAATVVALGLGVAVQGWKGHRAQELLVLASDEDNAPDASRNDRKVAHIERAVRLLPGSALLHSEAAHAHFSVSDGAGLAPTEDPPDAAPGRPSPDTTGRVADDEERRRRAHLVPALRHLLRSRDLSPARAMTHLVIATRVHSLGSADPQRRYLERVKLLAPADPWLWYQCGACALADHRPREAWADWKRSLELSSSHLPEILEASREHMGDREILRDLLPDRPELLLAVADGLPPGSDERRRPFRERALALLEGKPGPPSAEDLHTRATIHEALGHPDMALRAYREALLLQPGRFDWRQEFAEIAYAQGRFEESNRELLTILAFRPGDARARALLDSVARGLAEHR